MDGGRGRVAQQRHTNNTVRTRKGAFESHDCSGFVTLWNLAHVTTPSPASALGLHISRQQHLPAQTVPGAAAPGPHISARGGRGHVALSRQSAHPSTQMPRGAFSSRGATRTLPAPLPPLTSVALPVRRCPTQYSRVKSSPPALALVAAADGSGSGHGRVKVCMAVQLAHWQASRPSPSGNY